MSKALKCVHCEFEFAPVVTCPECNKEFTVGQRKRREDSNLGKMRIWVDEQGDSEWNGEAFGQAALERGVPIMGIQPLLYQLRKAGDVAIVKRGVYRSGSNASATEATPEATEPEVAEASEPQPEPTPEIVQESGGGNGDVDLTGIAEEDIAYIKSGYFADMDQTARAVWQRKKGITPSQVNHIRNP